ncbi:glycosyltransferase family 4 protein [Solihabitans fulvus]|uniref:Glycosyltransferase family 4 protein n=1 Tax=Solihabitans fulvus TaxID=1892852 RepID=A0A5B2XRN4_9PSEU|nr:glycosyltransferase family 4 protein [Solihabitans fulvus]KAA2265765.1 glycosyltransferase family 4 protein [Solihabitans fulvus]
MISFVWTASSTWDDPLPVVPSQGGTEMVTLGQCRELDRRGIANRIVTFRMGTDDGRGHSPDVRFEAYASVRELGRLDGRSLLVTEPLDAPADQPPFQILHGRPYVHLSRQHYRTALANRRLIAPSRAAARMWADHLGASPDTIAVMYPFADRAFGVRPLPPREPGPVRVLFAGRLSVEKGVYSFLETLHYFYGKDFVFTVVLAGALGNEYPLVEPLLKANLMVRTLPEQTRQQMAELLVTQDVVVMPGHGTLPPEPFGALSVEAQHAGCRVVAGDAGGHPETDCGGLVLFRPGDPIALAHAIRRAGRMGRLTEAEREKAAQRFTVAQSVDQLLEILDGDTPAYQP